MVFEFIAILSRSTPTLRSPFDETPYFFRPRAKRVALWWPNLSCRKCVPLVMGKRVVVSSFTCLFSMSRWFFTIDRRCGFFFIYEIFSFKFRKNLLSLIKIDNKKDIILDMTYIFNIPILNFQNFNLRFCMHIPGMQKFG